MITSNEQSFIAVFLLYLSCQYNSAASIKFDDDDNVFLGILQEHKNALFCHILKKITEPKISRFQLIII